MYLCKIVPRVSLATGDRKKRDPGNNIGIPVLQVRMDHWLLSVVLPRLVTLTKSNDLKLAWNFEHIHVHVSVN